MITISQYTTANKAEWDSFVAEAKNATFLHQRDYMDYHRDRFADHSLLARDGQRLVAVLPACRTGNTLHSHAGLTYGGWLTHARHFTTLTMLEVMARASETLRSQGITDIVYKAVPYIYHRYPADEDLYALFRAGATLQASSVSTSIPLDSNIGFDRGAKHALRHAASLGLTVAESDDWPHYWQALTQLLAERYHTAPVHTLDEIVSLRQAFPSNIRLFTATRDDELLAGVVMYYTHTVAHAQYIAATTQGKALGVLPLLFSHIITSHTQGCHHFDFGISCEDGGRYLNEGLLSQKCRLGGRAVVYNTYHLTL